MQPADLSCASMGSMSQSVWQTRGMPILAINAGSSSIRFALFDDGAPPARVRGGKIDRIGHADAELSVIGRDEGATPTRAALNGSSFPSAVEGLLKWLLSQDWLGEVESVGHRVVHGMSHTAPQRATGELLEELKRLGALDPEHIPQEIELIEALPRKLPQLPQVRASIPRFIAPCPAARRCCRFRAATMRQGRSALRLSRPVLHVSHAGTGAPRRSRAARGRVILAHLGSGASLAAVRDGQSHRHQHGIHADRRIDDGHAIGRPGSRRHESILPAARA